MPEQPERWDATATPAAIRVTATVGPRVTVIRRKRNMEQSQLIAALEERGFTFTQSTISRVEKGDRELNVGELFGFAAALDCSPLALLDLEDDVEVAGRVVDSWELRDWVRGFASPGWMDARAFYEAMPEDEWRAYRVDGVERLVRATTSRLLAALGDDETEAALGVLEDIERFVGTIRDELTEES
jgi:transcriptional regulator with XRE-family HTH domain